MVDLDKLKTESTADYIDRVLFLKKSGCINYTWKQIRDVILGQTGIIKSADTWRKLASYKYTDKLGCTTSEKSNISDVPPEDTVEQLQGLILEFKKERVKISDERTQNNVYVRKLAREETIKEIAIEVSKNISSRKILPFYYTTEDNNTDINEAIVQLSDWHYGIDICNEWNYFNKDVCKDRVSILRDEVLRFCRNHKVGKLHVVNLSDLIAGRIHSTIRLQSRIDVITQTIEVSEILAELLSFWSNEGLTIEYYDCLDNHSRLEPNKSESLDLESLTRIIPWYLKTRLEEYNVNINTNQFGDDIITFQVLDGKYKVAAVHGHKDRPARIVEGLTLMTKTHYDLILAAHLHHFSCDEKNETIVISNGSLMGTDAYAKDLRLSSKASQNIILITDDSVADYIHRIVLN